MHKVHETTKQRAQLLALVQPQLELGPLLNIAVCAHVFQEYIAHLKGTLGATVSLR